MSIIKHVTLQKIVAHDFRYDPRNCFHFFSRMGPIRVQIRFVVSAVNEFLSMGPRNTKLQSYQDGGTFVTDLYSAYTESESYVTGYHNKGLHLFFFSSAFPEEFQERTSK